MRLFNSTKPKRLRGSGFQKCCVATLGSTYLSSIALLVGSLFIGAANAQGVDNITVNGFFTAATGVMSNEQIRYGDYNKDLQFDSDSIMGLQLNFELDTNTDFISQLVAGGNDGTIRFWDFQGALKQIRDFEASLGSATLGFSHPKRSARCSRMR